MNKTIKIISTLLIAIMLVALLSQVVLATGPSSVITDLDSASYSSDKVKRYSKHSKKCVISN